MKHGLGRWDDILADAELTHLNGSKSVDEPEASAPPPLVPLTHQILLGRYKKIVLAFRRLLKKFQAMKQNVKIIGKMPGGGASGGDGEDEEKQRELKAAARAIALQVMGGLGEGLGARKAPRTRAEMEDSGTESDQEMSVKGADQQPGGKVEATANGAGQANEDEAMDSEATE